jgi:hypothetical protein
MQEQYDNDRRPGIRIDDYLICFPEGDIITEDEKGMSVLVDIFRLDRGNRIRVKQEELSEELEIKINAYINEMLISYIEEEEKRNGKNKSS